MGGRQAAWIPGATFLMGSDEFYPEERPVHLVTVDGFRMDRHPVTVAEFRCFVEATGYVTVAERPPDPADYPDAVPSLVVPGSLVFRRPPHGVNLRDWWTYVPSACWRRPEGPGSTAAGRERHPVTHVACADAEAYAAWAGKALPTEAEWELAARGGLEGAAFVWGNELAPGGRMLGNTWQGEFPWQNLATDGFEGTSPVGAFPPNGYGLYDMAGNVWEWTADCFTLHHSSDHAKPCCTPPGHARAAIPRRVLKGGSHLCAPNYCLRSAILDPASDGPRGSEQAPGDGALLCWDGLHSLDKEWALSGALQELTRLDLGEPDPDVDPLEQQRVRMHAVGRKYGAPDLRRRTFYRTVVDGRYKLVRWFSPEEYGSPATYEELYATSDVTLHDLVDDPGEMENLGHPEHPRHDRVLVERILAKLHALIEREIGEDHAPFDLDLFGTRAGATTRTP